MLDSVPLDGWGGGGLEGMGGGQFNWLSVQHKIHGAERFFAFRKLGEVNGRFMVKRQPLG